MPPEFRFSKQKIHRGFRRRAGKEESNCILFLEAATMPLGISPTSGRPHRSLWCRMPSIGQRGEQHVPPPDLPPPHIYGLGELRRASCFAFASLWKTRPHPTFACSIPLTGSAMLCLSFLDALFPPEIDVGFLRIAPWVTSLPFFHFRKLPRAAASAKPRSVLRRCSLLMQSRRRQFPRM